ncbi:hypothetical protein GOBAR_AA30697 [Gossypium barbadense]|uniref:Uncharacterized protein n=1 Tax=Gossypium barbadense TaxID=3634 RepID=A0A2P5WFX8_GOSBA|nr:hypothetical protein GOBAR_AA30697 [Gossypium barbadense]
MSHSQAVAEDIFMKIEGYKLKELDEWRTQKSRTPDKPNLRQNELNTFPNQLKVGDRVLLDVVDPHIVDTIPNEEIHLTILSIFPFGTVEVSHPKFSTFKTVMANYDDPGMVQLRLGRLICQLSVPEFGTALGLYTEEFKEENELHALTRHIHFSPLKCWHTLAPSAASYNPSRSKASVLPPSLRTYPPQYRLAQSTEEEAYKDIPDDVPLQHEDPPTQPPPPSHPVHAAASYADISECLTRFEQQCFQ